jgi:alkylated DNA repair dioxygenase AlkB
VAAALSAPCLPPGSAYFTDVVSADEEAAIVTQLDSAEWSNVLKRRVQHFGYLYDYRARTITADAYLGTLPEWLERIAKRLVDQGYFKSLPDQVIANEYLPGQGISAHVDCVPCFDDAIVSVSLLSACEMSFRDLRSLEMRAVLLAPRSGILLSGAGRYNWTHDIAARKSDFVDGVRLARERRISLTFRNVVDARSPEGLLREG